MNPIAEIKEESKRLHKQFRGLRPTGNVEKVRFAGYGETRFIYSERGTSISYVSHDITLPFWLCNILDGEFPANRFYNGELSATESLVEHKYISPVVVIALRGLRRAITDAYYFEGELIARTTKRKGGIRNIWVDIVEESLAARKLISYNTVGFDKTVADYKQGDVDPKLKVALDSLSLLLELYNSHNPDNLIVMNSFDKEKMRSVPFATVKPDEILISGDELRITADGKSFVRSGRLSLLPSARTPSIHLPSAIRSEYTEIPMETSDIARDDGIERAVRTRVKGSVQAYVEKMLDFDPDSGKVSRNGNVNLWLVGYQTELPK